MTIATLLNANDPAFDFDHRMAHQAMITAGGASALNFSGSPYWIDPPIGDDAVPSGWSNTLHIQAHLDLIDLFPTQTGSSAISQLNDISLFPEPDAWWQFSNFQLHYVAAQI